MELFAMSRIFIPTPGPSKHNLIPPQLISVFVTGVCGQHDGLLSTAGQTLGRNLDRRSKQAYTGGDATLFAHYFAVFRVFCPTSGSIGLFGASSAGRVWPRLSDVAPTDMYRSAPALI